MRKTKIICTLGPATDAPGVLEELIKNGMNVARFNFSHGKHADMKARLERLKEAREKLGMVKEGEAVISVIGVDAADNVSSSSEEYDVDANPE